AALVIVAAASLGSPDVVKADVPVAIHQISVPEAQIANGDHVVIGKDARYGPFTTCSKGTLLLQVNSTISTGIAPTDLVIRSRSESKDVRFEIELLEGPLVSHDNAKPDTKQFSTGAKQRLFS